MRSTEAEIASVRGELEIVQRALKLQTKRCRRLVAEYTRQLQEKERQYQSERLLREDQLARVLRALLIFEARLRQEQKFISHQLSEKDYIIKKQSNDIKKLMSESYCRNCKMYYSPSSNLESLDSSSEYVITDYQSSNFESLDSSSETYATTSEVNNDSGDNPAETAKMLYLKNKSKDSLSRRTKRIQHRKSVGTYFEVLKMRKTNISPFSNEDNTSNDYDNLESLPAESVISEKSNPSSSEEITLVTKDSDANDSGSYISVSEYNTVVPKTADNHEEVPNAEAAKDEGFVKISDSIPVFDADNDVNDNWYASASDVDDEEQKGVYRNNPVLECMNQILLQNINDSISSPPKTPSVERKVQKNKRVKFSDEDAASSKEEAVGAPENDYYETPIQKTPNFYETPQSIYSNDYEQILTKNTDSSEFPTKIDNKQEREVNKLSNKKLSIAKSIEFENTQQKPVHLYVDMDVKSESEEKETKIVRKNKILRTPPALPPKPTNLIAKCKIQIDHNKTKHFQQAEVDSEPDYCSISELNLPSNKCSKKISVVAEINTPAKEELDYDPVVVSETAPSMVTGKGVEKLSIQLAKQTNIKLDSAKRNSPKREPEIPKLPQVSEIIIPDEDSKQEERITCDNYVQNNSQILKLRCSEQMRHPIMMGSSVSALISGFNRQLLSEIGQPKVNQKRFSLEDVEKPAEQPETFDYDKFDLSQNFEEFKLDDCEILEDNSAVNTESLKFGKSSLEQLEKLKIDSNPPSTNVELIRATNDTLVMPKLNINSIEQFRKTLQNKSTSNKDLHKLNTPTYEHFLECTGLSSKSILTPSRLLSNHKSMLKPKDVKLRSKAARSNGLEKQGGGNTIKYWTEPFI